VARFSVTPRSPAQPGDRPGQDLLASLQGAGHAGRDGVGGEAVGTPVRLQDIVDDVVRAEADGFGSAWSVHFSRGVRLADDAERYRSSTLTDILVGGLGGGDDDSRAGPG
jgi:hypothetical protein